MMCLLPTYIATFLAVIAGLLSTSHAVPADAIAITYPAALPEVTAPASCTTTFTDTSHSTVWAGTHMCHTHTLTTADEASCPTLSCPAPATDQICPMYIKVSSTTVPCATDCCPRTPTAYVAGGPCPTCDPCRIPTEWITYTTGCPGGAGAGEGEGGTIASTTYVTPTYVAT